MCYFTPCLCTLLPHVSFHFYFNSLLYNDLFGLHIYCTQVVKFSLTHKQRSKHVLCIKCGNLKLHMWGMPWCMFDGCTQHWWPLLCGISTLAFSHSTCRNHHGYNFFYIVKCTFHALLCQWKVPSQLWMPRHYVCLWHIVLWWWVICAHHIAKGRRAYVSASLQCTVTTPQTVQEINGQLLLWFGVVWVSIIFYISNLLLKLQWHGT